MKHLLFFVSVFILAGSGKLYAQDKPKKTKVEEVKKICEGLTPADKPFIAVMPFKVGAPGAAPEVGTGLPDMLINAIFNTGCFRVVERDRLKEIMTEQGMGLSGAGDESSFSKVGKLAGAQVLIFGTITEFKENESGGGGGGGGLLRGRRGLGGIIGAAGTKTSHIGYTLRFVNPTTGELLDSKSFDKKRTSVGMAAGGGLFGVGGGGGGFYTSKSMQDALEESLIEAVEYMSSNKSTYLAVAKDGKSMANEQSKINKEDCNLLKLERKPKIMVIIPEEHLAGAGSNYDPNRRLNRININIDPAGETEITKRFLEFGFDLVDSKMYESIKTEKSFQQAFESPAVASQIGARFGADIIIVGEAFSEYSKAENGMSSCRARVEVKAVMTANAKILAAEGLHGSGMDVSEIIAGKTALRNAGSKVADYFLAQLCSKADDIAASMGNPKKSATTANTSQTDIQFNNVDFNKAIALGKIIQSVAGVSKAERVSFSDKIAKFSITHSGDRNTLIEKIIGNKTGIKLDVKSLEGNIANIDVR